MTPRFPYLLAALGLAIPSASAERYTAKPKSSASSKSRDHSSTGARRRDYRSSSPKSSSNHSSAGARRRDYRSSERDSSSASDESYGVESVEVESAYEDSGDGRWIASAGETEEATPLKLTVSPPSGDIDFQAHSSFQLVAAPATPALTFDARLSYRFLTFNTASWIFPESIGIEKKELRTTWTATAGYRVVDPALGQLTVDAGPAGTHLHGTSRVGMVAGFTGLAMLSRFASIDGAIRAYAFGQGSSALEASGALRVSIVRLGYRAVSLDGRSLHGPELGVAVSF